MSLDIKQKVFQLAEQIAEEQRVEIFDVELLGKGKLLLRVIIDKESGVTLEDCERFSKRLEALLDIEDPIPASYSLEISSPGLDRPLKSAKDFERSKGKLVRIVTIEKIDKQSFFRGRILETDNNFVKLLVNGHKIMEIPFDKISRAKLEIEL